MYRDHQTRQHGERDRVEVLFKTVRNVGVKRRIDHIAWIDHQECIAISRHLGHAAYGDIAAPAAYVFDEELRTQPLRKFLGDQTGDDVSRAARCIGNDHPYRPIGVILCTHDMRDRG